MWSGQPDFSLCLSSETFWKIRGKCWRDKTCSDSRWYLPGAEILTFKDGEDPDSHRKARGNNQRHNTSTELEWCVSGCKTEVSGITSRWISCE